MYVPVISLEKKEDNQQALIVQLLMGFFHHMIRQWTSCLGILLTWIQDRNVKKICPAVR